MRVQVALNEDLNEGMLRLPTVREIRLHGRGGQGTVKASEIIVVAAVSKGFYANSIPYFGFERRGAPVSAFVRISESPIRPKTQVYHPDAVVVMDETLMNAVDVFEGLAAEGVLVLNTKREADRVAVPSAVARVAVVDATSVALELLGRPVPNTTMLGAFCRATGWVDVDLVARRAAEVFGPKNEEAVRRGYEATTVLGRRASERGRARETGTACVGATAGASAAPCAGAGIGGASPDGGPASSRSGTAARYSFTGSLEAPVGTELYVIPTGDWRSHRPVWDDGRCTGCGICLPNCPVGAISFAPPKPGQKRHSVAVDLTYCKGCGICANECPQGAVRLVEEGVR